MNFTESLWSVGICYNEIQFVGITKLTGMFSSLAERAMLMKAIEFIEQAQSFAECELISKEPQGTFEVKNEGDITIGFTIAFKEPAKAQAFALQLRK